MKISCVVICLILLCFFCGFSTALTIYANDSQLIRTSDQIVYGKIVDVKSAWNAQKTHIETTAQILVAESFIKNNNSGINTGTTIPVTVLGGSVGNTSEWVEDMPVFIPDSDAILYLKRINNEKFTVNGLDKGIHVVFNDKAGSIKNRPSFSSVGDIQLFRERINKTLEGIQPDTYLYGSSKPLLVQVGASQPIISSVTPSSASAGTDAIITITGSGFGTKASRASLADVAFFQSYDGVSHSWIYASGWPAFDLNRSGFIIDNDSIVSWTDTRINVKVPTGIGYPSLYWSSANSGYLQVITDAGTGTAPFPFTVTFGYFETWGNAKKKWNSSPTYYINEGSVSGTATAVQNAALTWNNAGSPFRFNFGGITTSPAYGNDGRNNIYYGPPIDFQDHPDGIAFTSCWNSGEYVTDCDIEMNPSMTWTTGTASGSTNNVEATIVHELGHETGLTDLYGLLPVVDPVNFTGYPSDLSPENKIMFGYKGVLFGNLNLKTLSSSDRAGIRWIYNHTPAITLSPASLGPITQNTLYSQTVTASGGTSPYSYNVTSGTLPSGLSMSTSGTISGTPTAVGTSTFTITATDSNIRTGSQSYSLAVNGGNGDGNNAAVSTSFHFGTAGDLPVVGDWDGNGVSDAGVFRSSNGNWYLDTTRTGVVNKTFHFGTTGDIPVTGDWNNDGTINIGVFRPSNGNWYFDSTQTGTVASTFHFGTTGDNPVVGDWNNDGTANVGVFRPSNGNWYFDTTQTGTVTSTFHFGTTGDTPVAGDWSNNGTTNIGIFRPSNGNWYFDTTQTGTVASTFHFGTTGDNPVVGDWNADGSFDIGVFRQTSGNWYLNYNKTGVVDKTFHFGTAGDIPLVGDWNGDLRSDVGVFRPSNGMWYINYTSTP